ncbi:unnamed protein product [Closterium sp. NIES-53]
MHSRLLVSGLPRSLPPLPPSPAPPCLPCVEGQQRANPHSSSFPPTIAPLQTLHMDVWVPARISGQGRERYFLLVVDDYTRYTMVFPLRSKGQDLPVLRLHSDRGDEFSSDLLRDFCRGEGILQSFMLPESLQQNGIAEHRIGLVMEMACTSMIHAAAPHFLWMFAVWYAVHQLNLWPRASGGNAPGGAGAGGAGAGSTSAGSARAGGAGVGGTRAGGAGAAGAGAVDPGVGGARGTVRPQPYFIPLLQQVLGVPSSTSLPPPLVCPPPDQSELPLLSNSPLPAPSPYTEQSGGLTERREPASRPVSPVRTARCAPRPRRPRVRGTHAMAPHPSSFPLRVPLPPPPESSLRAVPDPESYRGCAASPTVSCFLTIVVTDPPFESTAASALVAELLDFAAACRLDYATALVAESESAGPPSVGGECALGMDVLKDRQEDL